MTAASRRIHRLICPDAEAIVEPLLREHLRWTVGRFVADHSLEGTRCAS